MQEEKSFELGGEEYINKQICVGERTVNFYKLDKSKKYKVEGKSPQGVMLTMLLVAVPFLALGIAAFFSDGVTSSGMMAVPVIFIVIGGIFGGVSVYNFNKARIKNQRYKFVSGDCTLTDGKVTNCSLEKRVSNSDNARNTTYEVYLSYSFYGLDGKIRHGNMSAAYSYDPEFYEGQNLMIAFNDEDSAVLSKFTLAEGAREFAEAEAERLEVDFSDLSGKLIDVDTSKTVKTRAYSGVCAVAGAAVLGFWFVAMLPFTIVAIVSDWGALIIIPWAVTGLFMAVPGVCLLVAGLKRGARLKKILKDPHFTKGVVFFRKTTFKGGSRAVFYRYKDADGGCHIEKFKGSSPVPLKDGERVIVAYSGGYSEIVSEYALRRGSKYGRIR